MRVTAKRYFQLSLIAPIVVPILFFPFHESALFALMLISLVFGGVPYVLFSLAVFVWSRDKTTEQLKHFSYFAPFIFGLFLALFYFVYSLAFEQKDLNIRYLASLLGLFALYGIGMGYAYVLIVNLGYFIIYERKSEP